MQNGYDLGREIARQLSTGNLVNDEIVNRVLGSVCGAMTAQRGSCSMAILER